jgi:hypothetical protein
MMKIDVNKSGRIFDFLVTTGMLVLAYDPSVKGIGPGKEGHVLGVPLDVINGRTHVTEIHPDGRVNGHGHGLGYGGASVLNGLNGFGGLSGLNGFKLNGAGGN